MGCAGSTTKESSSTSPGTSSKGQQGGAKPKSATDMPTKAIKEGGISASMFILDNKGKIFDYYDMDKKKLGEGSYGSVCKARHKSTKMRRAVKTISKAHMKNVERFKQEIAIMKMMDHPNIIKLYESFEDHRNIYLVMDLCEG